MNCSQCNRETAPVKINGQDYCSVCGEQYATAPVTPVALTPAPASRALSMDMAPRKPAQRSAASLHSRFKTASKADVIDLRKSRSMVDKLPLAIAPVVGAHTPGPRAKASIRDHEKSSITVRINQAKQYGRSPHINRFTDKVDRPAQSLSEQATEEDYKTELKTPALSEVAHPAPVSAAAELPQLAATHHEAMTRLAHHPPAEPPAAKPPQSDWRRSLRLSPSGNRVAATTAAIALMAGYIWIHNYPKLALQSASDKAGLSASMPGYIPSSYNLKQTETSPGLVTLSFSSPSLAEPLKIAQHRTTWDSSSLLDNFVAKHADDYATVQGQGLTIYLYNNNQATWVNRGVRYSIEGASRLSREQILKIAYSL